jgi:hypothetical protein
MSSCGDFEFNPFRNDDKIGNGLTKKKDQYMDYSEEPFFTCEMGIGVHTTRHRRSVIGRIDGLAMATNRVGSGSNLLGYYVFAGGSNPVGTLSSFNEDMDETGNWSETPSISYDFQAAISESGSLRPSYYESKTLSYFLNEFGTILAPMEPFFSKNNDGFQYAVRAAEKSAFVFGINYCRFSDKQKRNNVQFNVKLKNDNITFPSQPVSIPDSTIFIWPVNLNIDDIVLRYATAQPIARLVINSNETVWIFGQTGNITPEINFNSSNISTIDAGNATAKLVKAEWIVSGLKPGLDCKVSIKTTKGKWHTIIFLTPAESLQAWLLEDKGKKHFFISQETLYLSGNELHITGQSAQQKLKKLKDNTGIAGITPIASDGDFALFENQLNANSVKPGFSKKSLLEDAQWLKTSVDYIDEKNRLYHKIFLKEFNLGNPSPIKSALLYTAAPTTCRVQVNNLWVNQPIKAGEVTAVDITGYIKKGDNNLLVDFPFEKGNRSFAARLIITFFNSDEINLYTDTSWRLAEQYYFPSPLGTFANFFSTPQATINDANINTKYTGFTEYKLSLPCDYLLGLNNLYMSAKYWGIRAEMRLHHKLIADNYNNHTDWKVDLRRYGSQLQCRSIDLRVFPLSPADKILFDIPPPVEQIGKSNINTLEFISEYKSIFNLTEIK